MKLARLPAILAAVALVYVVGGLALCAWVYRWESARFEQTGRHLAVFR